MDIDYNHARNQHTLGSPQVALPILFGGRKPSNLLDVGCGTGTWLKAAIDFGIQDVLGIDGVRIPPERLHVAPEKVRRWDFKCPWNLNRRFEAVLCLEVAEHLHPACARGFISALVDHGDTIYFAAACPGQPGQHHVNCQWPAYWQELFNERGYTCEDNLRWQIWDEPRIEAWYRQNLFLARRAPELAGHEARIRAVVHPEMWKAMIHLCPASTFEDHLWQIQHGSNPAAWYVTVPPRALWAKLQRKLRRR